MTRSMFFVSATIILSGLKRVAFLVTVLLLVVGCQKEPEEPLPLEQVLKQPVSKDARRHYSRLEQGPIVRGKDVEVREKDVEVGPVVEWTPAKNRSWVELMPAHDTWEIVFLQGSRVGHTHTQIKLVKSKDGQEMVEVVTTNKIEMSRFGQSVKVASTIRSFESLKGEVIGFVEQMQGVESVGGQNSKVTRARVEGNRIDITIGKSRRSLAWSPANGGFSAVEHSLLSLPMKPGEHRRLRHLLPMFDTVVTTDLFARQPEPVKLLHGTYQLLRIDMKITLSDDSFMMGALWTDLKGQPFKSYMKLLDHETYLVTREEALAKYEPGKLDLGFDTLVKLGRPLDNPHGASQARYIVTLKDADPATVFTSSSSQSVEPIDAHTARLVVHMVRPEAGNGDIADPSDPPTREDLAPNRYIESNDPTIRAVAEKLSKSHASPWAKAVAAERYVFDLLEKADYSQVFSTAAETAKTRRGDCSEHSVLLAAIGRSMGIPSRVAIGLVYSGSLRAFGFHMWNEMYIEGAWIPMDATLGRGGIGVGHLKLGHTSLPNGLADPVFYVIPKTVGKLKIREEKERGN